MWLFAYNTWLCGLRSRVFHAVSLLGVLLIGIAFLSGYFSPRHPHTVALDVGFSVLRFSMVLMALYWVQEMFMREIDRRTVIFALTYPVSRSAYVLGRYLGILLLLAVAIVIQGLLLWIVVPLAGGGYQQFFMVSLGDAYWATIFGVWLDVAVIAAFAMWVAALATTSILPLALGAAFAIAGKALGPVQEYLAGGADGDKALAANYGLIVDLIRWVLPDLSRLDWRVWPMYGQPLAEGFMLWGGIMALCYATLMMSMAVVAFARRDFS